MANFEALTAPVKDFSKDLGKDLREIKDNVKDNVSTMGNSLKANLGDRGQQVLARGREFLRDEKDMVLDVARTGAQTAIGLVKRYPLATILGTAAVGVVIGAVLSYRVRNK